jgi:hypothetical protein
MRSSSLVSLIALLGGCPDRSIAVQEPNTGGAIIKKIPVSADIDILFVIDNSRSTSDKQTVFAQNFSKFVAALDTFPQKRPNLHIGVIDTTVDIGAQGWGNCPSPDPLDNGLLQSTPRVMGCSGPVGAAFLKDIDVAGTRQTNYAGTLDQALSCIAQLGDSGCGLEAPLEAMKRALDGSNPANNGFIRDGAYLAVIILTDEDDASTKDSSVFRLDDSTVGGHDDFRVQPLFAYLCDTPISASMPGMYTGCKPRTDSYLQDPAYYASFLSNVKDPSELVVAVIGGPPPGLMTNDNPPQTANSPTTIATGPFDTQPLALLPSCSATINGNPAVGRPGLRLASFLSNFGSRGRFYTVCQSDYSAALTDIRDTLFNAISPCLEGPISPTDVEPNNPGIQLDCDVSDQQPGGMPQPIVRCPMMDASHPAANAPTPCYWIDQDTTACPAPDTGYKINFVRDGAAPAGDIENVECAITTN